MFKRVANENKLNGLEKIKGVILEGTNWGELDLITPSFKKKRNKLKSYYLSKIDELYTKLY